MSRRFDPIELLELLDEYQVDHVVIGGVAAVSHGVPVATFDLDICYSRSPANLDRLAEALRAVGAHLRGAPDDVPFLVDAETLRAGDHFTFTTNLGDFDIMATPAGSAGFDALYEGGVEMDLDGHVIRVASIDDLITMKRAAGRPKDVAAIGLLEAARDEII